MTNDIPSTPEPAAQSWYVMCHLSPELISVMLEKDSRGDFQQDTHRRLPPYRYYIPFQYMPTVPSQGLRQTEANDRPYDAVGDRRALRSDLHNFVFVQATHERACAIIHSDWNRRARLHLYWYRDTTGREVVLPDSEVQQLIKTLQDRHLQFYFDQPLGDFVLGDQVILQMEPWVGRHAEVRQVKIQKDRIRMTVSLNILGRTKSINFPDVHVGDVRFLDPHKGHLLAGNPIDNYEEELLDILHNRYSRRTTEDTLRQDAQRLRRLASYTNIYIEDPVDRARFQALKLLCAYLRHDKKRVAPYTQDVLAAYTPAGPNPEELTAYQALILFIVTRNVTYRTAAKQYIQAHPETAATLRRYLSIVKDLKANPL